MLLMVIVEVVLVLGQPTSPTKNMILIETIKIGGFRHLSTSAQHQPYRYWRVRLLKLTLLTIINLVLHTVTVKVVWVLWPLTFPPINIIFGLMVVILCCQEVGIIKKLFIKKYRLSNPLSQRQSDSLVLLVMLDVVLVLGKPTPHPRNVILKEAGRYWNHG